MTTVNANPRRFSDTYSAHRVGETTAEGRMLAFFNYYGIWAETKLLALDWSYMVCRNCKRDEAFSFGKPDAPLFVHSLDEIEPDECPNCDGKTYPQSYAPDFVHDRKRKVVSEVYGAKSSTFDRAKLGFYRRAGITMIPIPNELTEEPKSARALCTAMAVILGTDKQDRLWEAEIAP